MPSLQGLPSVAAAPVMSGPLMLARPRRGLVLFVRCSVDQCARVRSEHFPPLSTSRAWPLPRPLTAG